MTQHVATMTLKALRALASEHGIAGRSKMNKAQLVSALSEALAEPVPVVQKLATPELRPEPEPVILTAADVLARRSTMPRNSGAPAKAAPTIQLHPHAGKGPLLPPLELPPMPVSYDDAFLTLLPQTPGSLVAIWSLTDAERRAFFGRTVELRLVDQTWNHQVVHRATPDGRTTRWAISGLTPDRTYRAMLGTLEGDRFVAVLWSKALALPPDQPRPWNSHGVQGGQASVPVGGKGSLPVSNLPSSHIFPKAVTR